MPVFPNKVPNLQEIGPIMEIIIFPPEPVFAKMKREGIDVPAKKVIALIDTGASGSCVDNDVAVEMGLISRDVATVHTPSGVDQQNVYDVGIAMPNLLDTIIPIQVLGANLKAQPYDALIGRDILSICTLIYNGWDNSYQIHL